MLTLLVKGAKAMKNPDYWQKKGSFKNNVFKGFMYKFKYPADMTDKSSTFNELVISDISTFNPNFIKLHSRINGFPIMPSLVFKLNVLLQRRTDEPIRINDLVDTVSFEITKDNAFKPDLGKFTKASSYSEYLNLGSNKKILTDFFDLTK